MVNISSDKGGVKGGFIFLAILIIVITIFVGISLAETENKYAVDPTMFTSRGLAVIESVNTYDVSYANQYLNMMKNFSDIDFEDLGTSETRSSTLKTRNIIDDVRGYEDNNNKYAIHLLGCKNSKRSCSFRVNGVPTGHLFDSQEKGDTEFQIDQNHKIRIDSITIDFCDGAQYCDLYYDAYDVVNLSIIKENKP